MKKVVFALAALAAVAVAGSARAQSRAIPFSVEVRGDLAFPAGDFAEGAETGVGFGATAALRVAPSVALYGGYSQARFGLKGAQSDAVDKGFEVGLTLGLPLAGSRARPWVGAGVLIHDLELDADGADFEVEGESDVGFEVGAGVALPLAANVRLTPGVGYRSYRSQFPATIGEVDVQYFSAGVGLNISF